MDSSFRVALYSRGTTTRPWFQDGGAFALPAAITFRAAQGLTAAHPAGGCQTL